MSVSLPQNDGDAAKRVDALRERRTQYRYAYDWPVGVATGSELHEEDHYSLSYLAGTISVYGKLGINLAAMTIEGFDGKEVAYHLTKRLASVRRKNLVHHIFTASQDAAKMLPDRRPRTWDEYRMYFETIEAPPIVSFFDRAEVDLDLAFAWQRMAGVNPMVLARCTQLPDHFRPDPERFAQLFDGDSLDAAAAEHRLYIADYAILNRLATGTTEGYAKFVAAPIALFCVDRKHRQLRPVAIQLGQSPGPTSPMVYPDGSWTWRSAMLTVQIADANVHQGISHLGRTHMVMEAVGLAVQRQLSPRHPLHKLLTPHLETTAAINYSAKTSLIAPGGTVDRCFAGTIEAFGDVVRTALATYPIESTGPLDDLKARGLDDTEALPQHPYRDDVTIIAGIVSDYVNDYVRLYYATDDDVAEDYELQAFVNELGDNDGGRLRGIPEVQTVAALQALITRFVFIAGPGHSCVNFPQFPFMGFIPNYCGASFSPIPTGEVDEAQFTAMQPPHRIAFEGLNMLYFLSENQHTTFGDYDWGAFGSEVKPTLKRLKSALAEAEKTIQARDGGRLITYPFLLPSRILQSISI